MSDPDRFDIGMGMRFSPIDPMSVREVIAVYRLDDMFGHDYTIGFIVRMPDDFPMGEYVYIVMKVESSIKRESVSTQYFDKLPSHLYQRSVEWITTGDVLTEINEQLGYAKAHAKHGESTTILTTSRETYDR